MLFSQPSQEHRLARVQHKMSKRNCWRFDCPVVSSHPSTWSHSHCNDSLAGDSQITCIYLFYWPSILCCLYYLYWTTVESGKNVTFFEQLFCFYQLVLVVWNTFGVKFKLSFISRVKQNWHFFVAMEEKIALPPFGGTFGGNGGPGKIISPVADSVGLRNSLFFYSITVLLVQFFWCSPCLPWQRWPIRTRARWSRIPGYKH